MESFTDKSGNTIELEIDCDDAVAYHEQREIGRIQFEEIDCDKGDSFVKLMNMDVNPEYRNAGIATKLMELAVEYHGNFSRPLLSAVGGIHAASEDYYTEEGAGFIQHCISHNILPPDSDESEEYNEDDQY